MSQPTKKEFSEEPQAKYELEGPGREQTKQERATPADRGELPPSRDHLGTPPANAPGGRLRLPYLPALDGLRALAVGAVLLYHAEVPWLPGGFLGVEVFFVISGYLITSLLLAEWHQTGSVDVVGFYVRRARRLLPAVFTAILVTLAFASLFLPEEAAGLRGDAVAAFGYVTNWHLIDEQKSYFVVMGRPSLLQHLWSLAVEEQFYLLWPLLLAIGARRLGRRGLIAAVLAGAVASSVLMAALYAPGQDPSRLYYGSDTRAAGLLFGAALALVWQPGRPTGTGVGRAFDLLGLLALGGLVWLLVVLDEFQPVLYQGGFAAVAVTTALAISTAAHPGARLMSLGMGSAPLRWLGTRSYSIYLWHWPIFMVTRPQIDLPFDGPAAFGLRLAATLLAAELSYRYVEAPCRAGALENAWRALRSAQGPSRTRVLVRGGGLALLALVLSTLILGSLLNPHSPAPYAYASVDGPDLASLATTASSPATVAPGVPLSPAGTSPLDPASAATEPIEPASTVSETSAGSGAEGASKSQAAPSTAQNGGDQTPGSSPTASPTATTNAAPAGAPSGPAPSAEEDVTAIGDSVMLFAGKELHQALPNLEIDAEIGLKIPGAIEIVKARRAAGRLGRIVVIHIGNNSGIGRKELAQIMELLSDRELVVLVNLKVPRRWEAPNNTIIADAAARYPNAVLVDWHGASANRPGLFRDDGVHVHPEGAHLYAQLIAAKIKGRS